MRRERISRRQLLRTAGGAALALPFLESLHRPARADVEFPKRLVIIFTAEGTIAEAWLQGTTSGFDLAFSPILSPLDPYKSDLLVLDGLTLSCDVDPLAGCGHGRAVCHGLTGAFHLPGTIQGGGGGPYGFP